MKRAKFNQGSLHFQTNMPPVPVSQLFQQAMYAFDHLIIFFGFTGEELIRRTARMSEHDAWFNTIALLADCKKYRTINPRNLYDVLTHYTDSEITLILHERFRGDKRLDPFRRNRKAAIAA